LFSYCIYFSAVLYSENLLIPFGFSAINVGLRANWGRHGFRPKHILQLLLYHSSLQRKRFVDRIS